MLGVALGGIGLLFVVDAALTAERKAREEDYSEFEEQHYKAFGFREEEESVGRQLLSWALAMTAIGYAFKETPTLMEELGL